jgi:hypothetical protein
MELICQRYAERSWMLPNSECHSKTIATGVLKHLLALARQARRGEKGVAEAILAEAGIF